MGGAFPELKRDPQFVIDLIYDEEESFGKTLDRGITLFAEAAEARAPGERSPATTRSSSTTRTASRSI
jgi:alanyl-tRNA synthetase